MKGINDGGQCQAERQRLEMLLSVYFQAQVWVAEWCGQAEKDTRPCELQGFSIHGAELDAMKIDREELLAQMLAGATENPWVKAAQSYDYQRLDGSVAASTPGTAVDGIRVERLCLKPHPRFLPYAAFIGILQKACEYFGRNYSSLLFQYRGCLCEDPMRLVLLFLTFKSEKYAILQALREWYSGACAKIQVWRPVERETFDDVPHRPPRDPVPSQSERGAYATPSFPECIPSGFCETDPRILWLKLPRHKMAEILHCSVRTLRRWERRGEAPGGLSWPHPQKIGGNLVIYDVARYWNSIQELLPRQRSFEKDMQLREEILSEKFA